MTRRPPTTWDELTLSIEAATPTIEVLYTPASGTRWEDMPSAPRTTLVRALNSMAFSMTNGDIMVGTDTTFRVTAMPDIALAAPTRPSADFGRLNQIIDNQAQRRRR